MDLKPIKNYEGLYSLDLNSNQVYSYYRKKFITPNLNNNYHQIALYKNTKEKKFQLHRLVYEAHYGTIPKGLLIDHIDNNTLKNNINNLRLATYSENNCNVKVKKKIKLDIKI